jgi:hypothetical protein
MKRFRHWAGAAVVLSVGLMTAPSSGEEGSRRAEAGKTDPAAVARTRETVKMLDDLYKSAVVHITETYVKARERTPAARAAKVVFKDMAAKGWHKARLIDVTGSPVNKENVARSDFEKRAVEELKKGKAYYEEVGEEGGKPLLLAATAVPVVMAACINCHPGMKEGQLIGALTYEVPIK